MGLGIRRISFPFFGNLSIFPLNSVPNNTLQKIIECQSFEMWDLIVLVSDHCLSFNL